jgi:hypothetical protein
MRHDSPVPKPYNVGYKLYYNAYMQVHDDRQHVTPSTGYRCRNPQGCTDTDTKVIRGPDTSIDTFQNSRYEDDTLCSGAEGIEPAISYAWSIDYTARCSVEISVRTCT